MNLNLSWDCVSFKLISHCVKVSIIPYKLCIVSGFQIYLAGYAFSPEHARGRVFHRDNCLFPLRKDSFIHLFTAKDKEHRFIIILLLFFMSNYINGILQIFAELFTEHKGY